jgi:hypothetical protein
MKNFSGKIVVNQQVTEFHHPMHNPGPGQQTESFSAMPPTLGDHERSFDDVTNDQFLTAIFGIQFTGAHPLVCQKIGDPDKSGWQAQAWPCNTSGEESNWYCQPSTYNPEQSGSYRAKKELAEAVYAVMVDDVGTKIPADRLAVCRPSWAIETSPGNFQYGYIFSAPLLDLQEADRLKERLIGAGLCDSGATGGAVRWMRLPVASNGRPKYGVPAPRCRLTQWRPELRYTVDELDTIFGLSLTSTTALAEASVGPTANLELSEDAGLVIAALRARGLYKRAISSGKHEVTCPWVKGHTDQIDSGAAYFEPTNQFPSGGFKCHHSHGQLFHISELKEFLGLSTSAVGQLQINLPRKLPAALLPVPPLDPDHLPDSIRDAVVDLADRLQCPMDYLAVTMLATAGAAVGNKVGIFPYAKDESWEVYPALWGGIVGDPGSKKSPSLQQALKPLQHLEKQASQKYAQDMQQHTQATNKYEKDLEGWSKSKEQAFKPTPPTAPKLERYVVHDSTYQALGVILAQNPRGVLALADELSGLLQGLDTPGQEAARGFYLTGWSGTGSYSFDRIGRGSISLSRYCLSVFGGFQPDRIKAYVRLSQRGSSKNDGLLQRFQLLVWPDPVVSLRLVDRLPDQSAINRYHQAILSLPVLAERPILGARRLHNGPQLLHFNSDAQDIFNSWYVTNEGLLNRGGLDSARQSHFAKYRSLIPALALLFHLLDGHDGHVCQDCLLRAIGFAKYLKKHANRIYSSASGYDHAGMRLLADRLLQGKIQDGFSARGLLIKNWSGLTCKEQAQSAIDGLVEYGWLSEAEIRTGGRPSVRYALNPKVSPDLL